jgi:hypothetical protein
VPRPPRQKKPQRSLCTAPGCPTGPRYQKRRERGRSPESIALEPKMRGAYAGHVRGGRAPSKAIERILSGDQRSWEMMERRADEAIAAGVDDLDVIRPIETLLAEIIERLRARRPGVRRVA